MKKCISASCTTISRHCTVECVICNASLTMQIYEELKEKKERHQQDLNLRPQRGTDVREIRICRRNHLAIVSIFQSYSAQLSDLDHRTRPFFWDDIRRHRTHFCRTN